MTTGADAFADATSLALGQSSEPTPAGSYTTEAGEPYPAQGRTAWWRWTAPATRLVLLDTTLMPTNADTVLTVYTGPSLDALTEVAVSDDVDPDNVDYRSFLMFTAQAGTTYHLQVDSWGSATPPDYVLRLRPGFEGPLTPAVTYVASIGRDGTPAQRSWPSGAPAYGVGLFPFTLQARQWDRNARADADATVFAYVRGALPGVPLGLGEDWALDLGAQRNPWGFETTEWFVDGYHATLDFLVRDAATYLPPRGDWPAGAVARVYADGSTQADVSFGAGSVSVAITDGNPELGADTTLMPGIAEYPVSAFLHQNPPELSSPWGMPETFPSDLPTTAQQRFSADGGFATWTIDPLGDQRVTLAHDFVADGVLPVDHPGTSEKWSYDVAALTVTAEMIVPAFRYVFTEPQGTPELPPARLFPRDDGRGMSAGPRVWPPPKSQQGSSRVGPGSYW